MPTIHDIKVVEGVFNENSSVDLLGDANPSGKFWDTEFDNRVEREVTNFSYIMHRYARDVLGYWVFPEREWVEDFLLAFVAVGYQSDVRFRQSEWETFWKPGIEAKIGFWAKSAAFGFINKYDRAMRALKELHAKGQVPDIIWNPNKYHSPDQDRNVFERLLDTLKAGGRNLLIAGTVGLVAYMVIPKIVRQRKRI